PAQRRHIRQAIAIYRALLAAGVIERLAIPDEDGRTVRLTGDLQLDFALNQALSLFALAAIELLDQDSPDYPLDVLSVLEATLDDPRQVLSAQLSKAKGEAVAAMKAEGIEYEERMRLLEDVTYPMPLTELLNGALDTYRRGHPWVADHRLSPKSVARDLAERAMTFTEYVGFYGLARSEGLVLRYLADAYQALRRTVPEDAKTDGLRDLQEWLGELVRQVDSSLLDEWERLRNPEAAGPDSPNFEAHGAPSAPVDQRPPPVTANTRAFRVLVRNALFRRVELAARRHWEELGELDSDAGWDAEAWRQAVTPYFEDHEEIGTGADARGPHLLIIDHQPGRWAVRQILDDPAGHHDWSINAEVDLVASDESGTAVLRVTAVGRL
ncbi:MAG: DUF3516 domain-containing protein, partial [Pseudonocardiaceae bacterium]